MVNYRTVNLLTVLSIADFMDLSRLQAGTNSISRDYYLPGHGLQIDNKIYVEHIETKHAKTVGRISGNPRNLPAVFFQIFVLTSAPLRKVNTTLPSG